MPSMYRVFSLARIPFSTLYWRIKPIQRYLINIFTGSWCWNRQHHGQTIHPTEKFYLLNFFKILCAVTWAWAFLSSDLMKAVRGQKRPLEAKKGMKELIYGKKCLIKVAQQPQKPLSGWATPQGKNLWVLKATDLHILNSRTKTKGLDL